jgi:Cu+-exporting ATPase
LSGDCIIDEEVIVATDPVCGMKVDEHSAAGKAQYKGQTYYFCSTACKTAFEQKPEQYVKATS